MPEMCTGRVRDCSGKPTARAGIAGWASEDLERKARPQATPIFRDWGIKISCWCFYKENDQK